MSPTIPYDQKRTSCILDDFFLDPQNQHNTLVLATVTQEDIQAQDTDQLLDLLSMMPANAKAVLKFDGYERDPREVWEIPEIRNFVKKALLRAPGILPRFTLHHRRMLRSCVLDHNREPLSDGRVRCRHSPLWHLIACAAGMDPLE
jgi:hypothetical protein